MSGDDVERTDPELWEAVKQELTESDKGGRPGQWSARKAQLAVQEYQRRGGGYRGEKPDDTSLRQWTDEDWGTKSGARSRDTGERYLPKGAREELSEEAYARTSEKKRRDSARGRQHSKQPDDVADTAAKHRQGGSEARSKKELYQAARARDIPGRSKMSKAELAAALDEA
jgi:hypothetical protein